MVLCASPLFLSVKNVTNELNCQMFHQQCAISLSRYYLIYCWAE